ncbi:MAG: hypothetical protein N4P95_00955, partial [Candidatus Lightella neohaematopini]|nr:hypothetical protein [Candidatus Lightella neohaematopini]
MKFIYPEQLINYKKYSTYFLYILTGNDYFLIQESKDYIKYYFCKNDFVIHNNLKIVCNTDFYNIINLLKKEDLFNYKHCFIITIDITYNNSDIEKEFILLCTKLINSKLCIIFYYESSYNNLINYYKDTLVKVLIINCDIIPKN